MDVTGCDNLIPVFHTRKHKININEDSEDKEMNTMLQHLNEGHCEFISNVLFNIAGYIISKLIDNLSCSECKRCLLPQPKDTSVDDYHYTATRYHQAGKTSAFSTFVNKGGLQIKVCQHFTLESTLPLFTDHEDGDNEAVVEDDHSTQLTKRVADKYFTLRLFNDGKKYTREIVNKVKQSDRHRFIKLTLFNNE